MDYSVSPDGEKFALPTENEYQKEYERLSRIVEGQREKGREIVVERFQRGGGTWTDSGKAEVYDRNWARGSGPDMGTGRTNLKFLFDYPLSKLTLKFGEFGENVNIKINGDFRNTGDFMDLNGTTVGGVLVTVQAQFDGHNWYGELILTGTINDFSIGSVELWIDDVCPTR